MIKALVEKQLFHYDELSDKVKSELYDCYYTIYCEAALDTFNDDVDLKINKLFNDHDLKLQYDFSCAQGSGSNLFGNVNAIELINNLELNHHVYVSMLHLIDEYGDKYIELQYNDRYCYSIIDRLTYFDDLLCEMCRNDISDDEAKEFENIINYVHDKTVTYLETLNNDFYELGTNLLNYPMNIFMDDIDNLLFDVSGNTYEPEDVIYEVK